MLGGIGSVGLLERGRRRSPLLVGPGLLAAPFVLTRTQAGSSSSTALNSDALNYSQFAADVVRFNGAARRLLIGGARTNSLPNPRCEGASGATPPTGMTLSATRNLTHTFTRTTRNGVEGFLWQMSGTPNSTSGTILSLEAGETSTAGRTCALGVFVELVAGTTANFASLTLRQQTESAGTATALSPNATLKRVTNVTTAVGTGYRACISYGHADLVTPVDITLFLGWPTREMDASFASTAILPVANTPAASSVGADLVSAPLSSLGINANGACTIVGSFMVPQNAPTGNPQALLHIDGGTVADRFLVQNTAGGAAIQFFATVGGVTVGSGTTGSMAAGTPFNLGISLDGTGLITTCLNGATPVAASGGPTSGLTTLRLGSNANNIAPMFGEVGDLRVLSYAVSSAQLRSLVARHPNY